jgi:hypothetical protein
MRLLEAGWRELELDDGYVTVNEGQTYYAAAIRRTLPDALSLGLRTYPPPSLEVVHGDERYAVWVYGEPLQQHHGDRVSELLARLLGGKPAEQILVPGVGRKLIDGEQIAYDPTQLDDDTTGALKRALGDQTPIWIRGGVKGRKIAASRLRASA